MQIINFFLGLFNKKIVFVCAWGTYKHRYDSIDLAAMRPIHENMSVAPPWARMKIIQNSC